MILNLVEKEIQQISRCNLALASESTKTKSASLSIYIDSIFSLQAIIITTNSLQVNLVYTNCCKHFSIRGIYTQGKTLIRCLHYITLHNFSFTSKLKSLLHSSSTPLLSEFFAGQLVLISAWLNILLHKHRQCENTHRLKRHRHTQTHMPTE